MMRLASGSRVLLALLAASSACSGPHQGDEPEVLSGVAALASGDGYSCALMADTTVRCWGKGTAGQLAGSADSATAVLVPGIQLAVGISAGAGHACAALMDGTVKCWGKLPSELSADLNAPQPPTIIDGVSDAIAVACGREHTCALGANGKVRCWGINTLGTLGDGGTDTSLSPVEVAGVDRASAISVGYDHSCALLDDGTVKCWGKVWTTSTSVVDGFAEQRTFATGSATPRLVAELGASSAITLGNNVSCALLQDATVRCWGSNAFGRLGSDDPNDSAVPVLVKGLSGVHAISSSDTHSCAVLADGSLRCWGDSHLASVNGEAVNPYVPSAGTVQDPLAVAAGHSHTCVLQADTTVHCWGAFNDLLLNQNDLLTKEVLKGSR
ncbi:MAG: hypothetical protein ABIQ16_14560 [Polyangiaceae bacterium]